MTSPVHQALDRFESRITETREMYRRDVEDRRANPTGSWALGYAQGAMYSLDRVIEWFRELRKELGAEASS